MNSIHLEAEKLAEYQTLFQMNKIVVIPDAFNTTLVNSLYDYLNNPPKSYFWKAARIKGKVTYTKDIPANESVLNSTLASATAIYRKGIDFSYFFGRTLNHGANCICAMCAIMGPVLMSSEMIDFISQVTDKTIIKPTSVYASYHKEGDFLGNHTDQGIGQIGFSVCLTKNWIPSYAGYFSLLRKDKDPIVILPDFNQLIIFDVCGCGQVHAIAPVETGVNAVKRLSIDGWYK